MKRIIKTCNDKVEEKKHINVICYLNTREIEFLLCCGFFSILGFPKGECGDNLTDINERARLPHYHFIPKGHGAVNGRAKGAEHL